VPGIPSRLAAALADRYRIERELGQGGMATVYLAEDLRHQRSVALKVLRPELAAVIGADRFLSEIRTTANLQHPHIVALYDSGAADSFLFYVMPYLEGESLRDRLSREKQLPIDDAIRIAGEIASALDYAHRRGVIHRDIKPENIMLHDGRALVADFGIALAATTAGPRLTETGLSLGTPAYMSPEQAVGERALDARTDVYALGCVTYEMITGEPPFTGPTAQAIIAKVMAAAPMPPSTLRQRVPPGVEAAVLSALEKLPADRVASAAKFAEALVRPGVAGPAVAARAAAMGTRSSPRWVAAAVGGALLLTAAGWWLGHRSHAGEESWSVFTQLTDASGVETGPSLSPDGANFAYASDVRGTWDIYVQRVGGRNPVLVAGDSTLDEVWPAYSPDGGRIAYNVQGGGIFVMGATGESARRLTTFGANPAWSPDGQRIVFGAEEVLTPYNTSNAGTLWVVDANGGEPRLLDSLVHGDGYQPAWSPSGTRIAFWTSTNGQRDLVTIPAEGGVRRKVTDDVAVDWAPVWSPDGRYLYFASDRGGAMGLWRIAVDQGSGRTGGLPEPVASGVDVAMDLPHLSRDGRSLLFRSKLESVNPAVISFDPATERAGPVRLLQHRTGVLLPNDVSRDGRRLALYNALSRQQDLFVMHADGSGLTRLTDDAARDFWPVFTPDGKSLAFYSNQSGKYEGWSIGLDGSGRTRLTDLSSPTYGPVFSPDGTRLVFSLLPMGAVIGGLPWPITDQTAKPLAGLEVPGGTLQPGTWSPDGRWLAGNITTPTGEAQGVGVYELAAAAASTLSDDTRGYGIAWLPDSRRVVYFTKRGALVVQDIVSRARREVAGVLPYPPDGFGSISASRDGRALYYGAQQVEANIWLVTRPVSR
jgi:Tol biopolymer transport system component